MRLPKLAPVFALTLTAISSALSAAPAPTPAKSPVAEWKTAQAEYARFNTQSYNCDWGRPVLDAIVTSHYFRAQKLARLQDKAGVDAAKDPVVAAAPCNSPINEQAKNSAYLRMWESLTWLVQLSNLMQQPGWGQGLIDIKRNTLVQLEPGRAEIEKAMVATNGEAQVRKSIEAMGQQAVLTLNLACEGRKNHNVKSPRTCPAVPANMLPHLPAATVYAERAESLSRTLTDAAGEEMRGEFGQAYRLRQGSMDYDSTCKSGMWIIYPKAPDTKKLADGVLEVALHKYGAPGPFPRGKVRANANSGYQIIDAPALGLGYMQQAMASFSQCWRA